MSKFDDIMKLVRGIGYGDAGLAGYVPPEWPESDPRWEVVGIEADHNARRQIVESIISEMDDDYAKAITEFSNSGKMTRPEIALVLGISLHDLLVMVGEAPRGRRS